MSERIEYIDTAKLIGLILVCFCHIPNVEGNFHVWVYSFHMPLFFILSGLFFNPERFSLKKTIFQLLLPFIYYNILIIGISFCISLIVNGSSFSVIDYCRRIINNYDIGPSWFLLSLFTIRLICGYIYRIINAQIGLCIAAILFVLILIFSEDAPIWNYLCIGPTILGLPFYVFGYLIRKWFFRYINYGGILLTLMLVPVSIFAIINGQVNLFEHGYGNNIFLMYLFGICGSFILIRICRYIHMPQRIVSVFMEGSLFIICMHIMIFEYSILIWNKITSDFSGNTLIEKIVFTLVTFAISYPIIVLLSRKAPFILGRPRKETI